MNGQNAEKESLEDVILHVKRGEDTLSLLVVDQKGYDWLKKNEKPITVNKLAPISEVCNNTVYLTALSVIKPHTPNVFKTHKQRHHLSHALYLYKFMNLLQVEENVSSAAEPPTLKTDDLSDDSTYAYDSTHDST